MIRKAVWVFMVLLIGIVLGHCVKRVQARQANPDAPFFMPSMELANITLTKLTKEQVNMSMAMVLDNPLPIGFAVDSFTFAMAIDDREVVRSTYPDPIGIDRI